MMSPAVAEIAADTLRIRRDVAIARVRHKIVGVVSIISKYPNPGMRIGTLTTSAWRFSMRKQSDESDRS